jgi:hypothetical protein
MSIPKGNWKLIATEQQVDHVNAVTITDKKRLNQNSARLNNNVTLPAQSLRIWVK